MNYNQQAAFIVVCLLLAAAVVPFGAAGVSSDSSPDVMTNDDPQSENIETTLQAATGETEVIVRLTEIEPTAVTTSADPTETLRSQANRTQKPLLEYAAVTDGVEIKERFWIANAVLLGVDTSRVPLEEISALGGVERLHPNFEVETLSTQASTGSTVAGPVMSTGTTKPATVDATYTYGLEQINAPDVWAEFGTKGAGTTIAVLDTGVDVSNHPDLDLIDGGWKDFVNGQTEPYDDQGHGTHVSGTVGGEQMDDGTHYGVAPEANLLHGKVANKRGNASFNNILAGMQWAVEHESGVDVLSISLGSNDYVSESIEPVRNARAADVVVVAAAGNSGHGTSSSPANVYDSISVGASAADETIRSFSSGETVDTAAAWGSDAPAEWPSTYIVPTISAPGSSVQSAVAGGGYGSLSGTSMATPHVAGTVGLLQSATDESLSPAEIEAALTETAWKPSGEPDEPDERYGTGIIDAYAATVSVAGEPPSANFTLRSASVSETKIFVNESVTTTAEIENTGEIAGTFTADLRIDDTVAETTSVEVAAGETETISFDSTFAEPGDYTIAVNDLHAGELRVDSPPVFVVSELDPETATVKQGTTLNISALISNEGTAGGTKTVALQIDSTQIRMENYTLEGGQAVTVTFDMVDTTELPPSEYEHSVWTEDDVATGLLTIEESDDESTETHPSGVSQSVFDAVDLNDNGDLSLGELRNAVSEWSDNREIAGVSITLGDLRMLVAWWR